MRIRSRAPARRLAAPVRRRIGWLTPHGLDQAPTQAPPDGLVGLTNDDQPDLGDIAPTTPPEPHEPGYRHCRPKGHLIFLTRFFPTPPSYRATHELRAIDAVSGDILFEGIYDATTKDDEKWNSGEFKDLVTVTNNLIQRASAF